MKYSKIVSTGAYLPENIVTNYDLEKRVDTSHDWIVERTGIYQRHIAADTQTTAEIAEHAALDALKRSSVKVDDLDLIIVATSSADHIYPSTATLLQARLGNKTAAAFDVTAACSGFVYALSIADNFIKAGGAKRALIVGAEIYSRLLDWEDRATCVLFGDGAGAMILEAVDKQSSDGYQTGVISTHIHANGEHASLLTIAKGPGARPNVALSPYVQMKGNEVFKHAVNTLHKIVEEALQANSMQPDQIDWLIPHQANLRIITATAKKLGMSMDRVILTVDKHANTSAASIPLALHQGIMDGRIRSGQTVLLEAFGGGFTWGAAVIRL